MKKLFFVGILSIVSSQLECVVAVGDTSGSSSTFQFSIGSAIYQNTTNPSRTVGQMWAASGQDISLSDSSIQKYGISYTPFIGPDNSSGAAVLKSYPNLTTSAIVTQLTATLSVSPTEANPLLGKAYTALTLVGTAPTVVCTLEPRTIYLIEKVSFNDNNLGLTSADGTSVVNKFSYAETSQIAAIGGIGSTNLFAAYAPGSFGATGSTLSYLQLIPQANLQGDQIGTYSCLQEQASQPIALTTEVLIASTASLNSIGSSVAMYPAGNKMYIGLDVRSGTESGNCGVGLFTATGVNSTGETPGVLTFSSVLPDAVVTNDESITTVVSVQNSHQVAIRNITTTTTSTGLGYLFVSRDNGVGQQSIYAMPMVTMPGRNVNFGKIAKFNSVEKTFKITGTTYRQQGFSEVIDDASEININGVQAVINRLLVGGSAVPIVAGQYISQMIAQGDCVYIVIPEQFAVGTTPGMFKSQALFDQTGRVMSWTPWQRVVGTDQQILFAMNNRISGCTMFVSAPLSQSTPDFNTIQQTTWNNNADLAAYSAKVTSALPKNNGGVQGNFPFPSSTSGFTGVGSEVSMLVTTGNSNVLVAQTGWLDGTNFKILPQTNHASIVIDTTLGLSIGSVVTADFGHDASGNNWLFFGGDQGLSVLSTDGGAGFQVLPNIEAALHLILDGQTCKTLGNFTFVKKIVSSGYYLYVMTQNAVYQILLLETKFTASNPVALDAVQVISATQLAPFAYCLDMLVDDHGFILLGTTAGLYSIDISGGIPGVVTPISIPQGLSSISKIQTLSNSLNGNDFYTSSNLYVLSIDYSTLQARLNRFMIVNGVVTPIQDQLFENEDGPLLIFDYMNNNMFIDGSFGYMTAYKMGTQPATIKYLQYILQAGISGRHASLADSTSDVSIKPIADALNIAGVTRDFASGCLMLAADFGLLTLS